MPSKRSFPLSESEKIKNFGLDEVATIEQEIFRLSRKAIFEELEMDDVRKLDLLLKNKKMIIDHNREFQKEDEIDVGGNKDELLALAEGSADEEKDG